MQAPKERSVLYFKWNIEEESIIKDMDLHIASSPDLSERDNLAKKFNASENDKERLDLLYKMKPYDILIQKHSDGYNALRKREKANDKLYKSFN